jgi:predicted transcriptional regulator
MVKYRNRVDIIAAILNVAVAGAKKTRIMYFANLSYRLLEKYLAETSEIGFLQVNNDGYIVTERGRVFLDKYKDFSSKYSSVEKTLQSMSSERGLLERMCQPTVGQRSSSSKMRRVYSQKLLGTKVEAESSVEA